MQALSGMVVYFIVMNDYGFKPGTLMGLNLKPGYVPDASNYYQPHLTTQGYGNSNNGTLSNYLEALAWGSNEGSSMDLRLFYTSVPPEGWSPCQYRPDDESIPLHWRISEFTGQ
jgi:hypothetical protein